MKPSVRHSVILALAQTGVLVLGILGVAASNRLARGMGYPDLRDFLFFMNHGWLLLPIPLVWIAVSARLLLHQGVERSRELAVLLSGVALIVLFSCALASETIAPWRAHRAEPQTPTELGI